MFGDNASAVSMRSGVTLGSSKELKDATEPPELLAIDRRLESLLFSLDEALNSLDSDVARICGRHGVQNMPTANAPAPEPSNYVERLTMRLQWLDRITGNAHSVRKVLSTVI